jgi:phenylacetic acid degradation operon negative regulatory protein
VTDQPRYRATANGLTVGFVFGALSASTLSGPVLMALLGGLDLHQSAARNAVTRMVHMGALTATRVGRTSLYSLADQPRRKYKQVEGTTHDEPWDGTFHCIVYDIPERERGFRDRFRHLAAFNTYGLLRPGVLISPRAHSPQMDEAIAARPSGIRIHCTRLHPTDLTQARQMANETWNLAAMAGRYTRVIATIDAERRAGIGPLDDPWPAVRRLRRLYDEVVGLQLDDPALPPELLPAAWPRSTYWQRLFALNCEWGTKLLPPLREIANAIDRQRLCEYYRPIWDDAELPPSLKE